MRVLRSLLWVLLICAFLVSTVHAQPPVGASQIKHVVFILKENHTFDNYFGAFPGADGASSGKIHTGATVPLTRAPDVSPGDINHTWDAALLGIAGGKMDGFDLIRGARQDGILYSYTQYHNQTNCPTILPMHINSRWRMRSSPQCMAQASQTISTRWLPKPGAPSTIQFFRVEA